MEIKPAIESENMVIGALLLDGSLYNDVKCMLCPNDFTTEQHQEIYAGMMDLFEKHGCFDIAMLVDELSIPACILHALAEKCFATSNIVAHASIIREKLVQRQLIQCAKEIEEQKE